MFTGFLLSFPAPQAVAARPLPRLRLLLPPQAEAVRDHGDELTVGGLALDVAHGVAEELLQRLEVSPVPCHLDGVADFQGLRPEIGARFCVGL